MRAKWCTVVCTSLCDCQCQLKATTSKQLMAVGTVLHSGHFCWTWGAALLLWTDVSPLTLRRRGGGGGGGVHSVSVYPSHTTLELAAHHGIQYHTNNTSSKQSSFDNMIKISLMHCNMIYVKSGKSMRTHGHKHTHQEIESRLQPSRETNDL